MKFLICFYLNAIVQHYARTSLQVSHGQENRHNCYPGRNSPVWIIPLVLVPEEPPLFRSPEFSSSLSYISVYQTVNIIIFLLFCKLYQDFIPDNPLDFRNHHLSGYGTTIPFEAPARCSGWRSSNKSENSLLLYNDKDCEES